MENNNQLFNAAVVGENSESAFIIEGNRLHAVEKSIADQKRDKSDPKKVIPLLRDALNGIIAFAKGKVEEHFIEVDLKMMEGKSNEQALLVSKIVHIFSHLPHNERNELSSLIHHKQVSR